MPAPGTSEITTPTRASRVPAQVASAMAAKLLPLPEPSTPSTSGPLMGQASSSGPRWIAATSRVVDFPGTIGTNSIRAPASRSTLRSSASRVSNR